MATATATATDDDSDHPPKFTHYDTATPDDSYFRVQFRLLRASTTFLCPVSPVLNRVW
jgi:hypothetical protein